jgi:hypothetical protein
MSRSTRIMAFLVALPLALVAYAQVSSQNATLVQQAQPLYTCNQTATATGVANTAVTVTLTPPAGQYVYICSVYIAEATNAAVTVGAGPAPIFTTTNLPNNMVWWGDNSALAQGVQKTLTDVAYPLLIKSNVPGTAFTIVTSGGQATQNVRINVTGFFAQ